MIVRPEREGDYAAIAAVTEAAFVGAPHSSGTEAAIIGRLRADGDLALSLVTEVEGSIIGHVAFSPVLVGGADRDWFGLGPLSVRPDHQGKAIGSALVRSGLQQLRSAGASGCVVLGDPTYYARFGFISAAGLHYADVPPEYFMQLTWTDDRSVTGQVSYAAAFST